MSLPGAVSYYIYKYTRNLRIKLKMCNRKRSPSSKLNQLLTQGSVCRGILTHSQTLNQSLGGCPREWGRMGREIAFPFSGSCCRRVRGLRGDRGNMPAPTLGTLLAIWQHVGVRVNLHKTSHRFPVLREDHFSF